ncbi:siderophore ABC transporter substrate-binding protein [Roseicyclus sp. F158]|uniref:Siderophore ABC transporter substrate-binding protein n=1 Tax=Tropicimonas omnivorans TaxID=3075590 RepID=A0ABU3DFX2_9RHOB|nr:siderophore ABC transporter substrate-binding protein [Roseicyclus sp. F158]MDT0682454.1 siderophore ABC transporter substrate-binding protein [Roseicyclus sp. F158]
MFRTALGAALTGAVLASPVLAEEVSVETARGPVSVESSPESVLVYDMTALDTMDALGVEGITTIENVLLDYANDYPGIPGTLFEPDFEAVNALQPDLIIAGGRSAAQVDDLSRFAPTLDMTVPGENGLEVALSRIDAYGTLFDREDEAAALSAEIESKIEEVRAAGEGKGTGLVVLTNGPKVSAYGAGSRFGWIHEVSGLPEAVEGLDTGTHGEAVSFEYIREANPDWLLVIDRVAAIGAEGDSARATLDNPLVRETTAWQNDQVIYLNAADIYLSGGGATSLSNTLDILADAFGSTGS